MMFRKIKTIAKNTFREAIRDKVLYALAGFGILFVLADLFLAKVVRGDIAMIKSFGLAGIYLFGIIIAVFLGASIIYKEIDRRTLYFVLSKPVSRLDIILGKFIGLSSAILLTVSLMGIMYLGVIAYEGGGFDSAGLISIFIQLLEEILLVSLLIFFSSFMSPLTATLSAIIIIFIGHLGDVVLKNAEIIGGITNEIMQAAYYVLPNLSKFDLRAFAVHDIQIPPVEVALIFTYGFLYSCLLISVAFFIFKKREL